MKSCSRCAEFALTAFKDKTEAVENRLNEQKKSAVFLQSAGENTAYPRNANPSAYENSASLAEKVAATQADVNGDYQPSQENIGGRRPLSDKKRLGL